MKIIAPPTTDHKINSQPSDAPLGPTVTMKFLPNLEDADHGWWDPDEQTITVDANDRGVDFAQTVLHEIGHMLCADGAENLTDDEHDRIEAWAGQAARLLALLRPGRRAVPAAI